jgi:predicted nucleic acid-binding protein
VWTYTTRWDTTYDAAYLELALRLECQLATLVTDLKAAALASGWAGCSWAEPTGDRRI